jgi:hypothetical protein
VKAAIRVRLIAAGLRVDMGSESQDRRDDAVLTVDYREERGQQVTLDIYGTEVTSQFILEHPERGRLLALTIRESPHYGRLSTLPYVDVIQQFETNPYFYFLGDIVLGAMVGQEAASSLVAAVARYADSHASRPSGTDQYPEAAETLPSFEPQYELQALARAIEEVARLKQRGSAPILTKLLTHPDWRVRLHAVRGIETLGAVESTPILSEIARHDSDGDVRQAAQHALAQLERTDAPADTRLP